jgi:hypothetical protein
VFVLVVELHQGHNERLFFEEHREVRTQQWQWFAVCDSLFLEEIVSGRRPLVEQINRDWDQIENESRLEFSISILSTNTSS